MKGKKYKIDFVKCFSCGVGIIPDTESGVTLIKDGYKLYFCEECSDKKEHVIEANTHAAGTVPDKIITISRIT